MSHQWHKMLIGNLMSPLIGPNCSQVYVPGARKIWFVAEKASLIIFKMITMIVSDYKLKILLLHYE